MFGYDCEDGRRITRCISFLRADTTDNGYARPIEGLIVHFDMAEQQGDRGHRPRRHAAPAEPRRATTPRISRRMREGLKPISITQPEGVSFTVDGNRVDWQKWSFRIGFDPVRRAGAAPDRLRRQRPRAFDPAPRVDLGDGRALRRPRRAARLEERVRRGRVGPRPDDAAAHARLRLPRRDPLLRRDDRQRAGQAVGDLERDLHARRGLRDPLEARRPAWAAAPRCGAAGGSS